MTLSDSPTSTSSKRGSSFGRGAVAAGAERLAQFANKLSAAGVADMPANEAADTITMLADEQLRSFRESAQAGLLAQEVKRWYQQCQSARTAYEQQWYKNLDMVQGRQYTEWSKAKGTMVQRQGLPYEPRLVVNVLEPVVRTELAKVGGSHPNVTVVPASNEEEDLMAARAGEQVWDWFYDFEKIDATLRHAQWWTSVTGNAYVKDYWDAGATDPTIAPPPKDNEDGVPSFLPNRGFTVQPPKAKPKPGRIRAQAITPFHVYVPDLTEPNLQDQPYMLHVYPLTLETARRRYAKFIGADWIPSKKSTDDIVQSANLLGGKGTNTSNVDVVVVVEAYVKPEVSRFLPNGGVVVMIGDEIVAASTDGLPYRHGEFPFHHLTHIETGSFYRKSVIETMTPLQDDLNRMYSQMTKHRNLMLAPQMFYDAGSVDVRKIQNRAGQWIPIALGANKPVPVPLPEVPNTFWQFLSKLREEMDNQSGQHDVSRAVAPGADTAASAISVLQEADNNFMFDRIASTEALTQGLARHMIALAVQFWDDPRIVKIVGDDGALDVKQLRGADLERATDIRVESGSGLPEGKAARIAVIRDYIKDGIITAADGLKALEMGNLTRVFRATKIDEDQAARENLAMKGMDPEVAKQKQGDAEMAAMLEDTMEELEEEQTTQALSDAGSMGSNPMADPPAVSDPDADQELGEDPLTAQQDDAPFGAPQDDAPFAPGSPAGAPMAPAAGAPGQPGADPTAAMPGVQQDPSTTIDPTASAPVLAEQPMTPTAVPVHDWDNHAVHIQVHERFMKSQEYEMLDPEVRKIFIAHRQAHIEAAGRQAQLQTAVGSEPTGYAGDAPAGTPSPAPAP